MDEEEKMINLGVLMEDVHVIFSSRGLGSEDILKILFKIFCQNFDALTTTTFIVFTLPFNTC